MLPIMVRTSDSLQSIGTRNKKKQLRRVTLQVSKRNLKKTVNRNMITFARPKENGIK